MGCKTRGYNFGLCAGFSGINPEHCAHYTPIGGVTFEYKEYPQNVIRQGDYEIPDREDNRVMYPYNLESVTPATGGTTGSGSGISAANCGKLSKPDPCASGFGGADGAVSTLITDWFPTELSFDFNFSDTWFSYLYDTSVKSGIVGTPCYYIETETSSSSSGGSGSRQICHPCTLFTSTPAETQITYTAEEDLTGDPDCPHPTLFAIDTNSDKIVFSYDQLSTTLPNGATDFALSYDGVTYTDAWDPDNENPIEYESSQNPWQAGDEAASEFEIYDFTSGATKSDFIVKARVEPIFDDTGAATVFSGTKWIITELLNPGTGYAVGDVFQMTLLHSHPDNSQTTLTMNIKVTGIGPVDNVTSTTGFDVLRVNDKINGHTITRTFHTDDENFKYHVVYLDGDGLDFTKDTQYSSDRNHDITVVAGYGIKDRACLVGLYEFLNKSIQFLTADVNKNAASAFNSIFQPIGFATVTNGAVTGLSFDGQVMGLDVTNIKRNRRNSYSDADNVSLTGGDGSGCVVNIVTDDNGMISEVIIVDPGSGYNIGNVLEIPGSQRPSGTPKNALIDVILASRPGSGFENLKVEPILEISPSPLAPIDDNNDAKVDATFVGGSVSSVLITKGGIGYDQLNPPTVTVNNINDPIQITVENDGFNPNLVDDYQGILNSLPEGRPESPKISADDLQSIEDSYSFVPESTDVVNQSPKFEVKMDPENERVEQLPQHKYSSDATTPLKTIMKNDWDTTYLKDVPIDAEYKQVFPDEIARSNEQISDDIDSITQQQIPAFQELPETKLETCVGSFTNLPTASPFTKYIMRQYRPDPAKVTEIQVSLTCTPQDIGCGHIVCAPPALSPGYSETLGTGTFTTDPETGESTEDTETTTYSYAMSALLGPGAQPWTATGSMKIFHDLTRDAQTVILATDAYGNPFAT
jgi:hypothetical protein